MCMLSLVWDVACWRMLALRKAWHFSEGLRTATQKPLTVRATMSHNTQDPHGGTAVQKPCRLCVCDTTGIPPQFPWKLQPVTGTLKRFLSTCRAEVLSCCYRSTSSESVSEEAETVQPFVSSSSFSRATCGYLLDATGTRCWFRGPNKTVKIQRLWKYVWICMVFEKRLGPGEKKCDLVDLSSVEFP